MSNPITRRPMTNWLPMTTNPDLTQLLHKIGLVTLAGELEDFLARATKGRWSPRQILEELARREHEERAQRSLKRRLRLTFRTSRPYYLGIFFPACRGGRKARSGTWRNARICFCKAVNSGGKTCTEAAPNSVESEGRFRLSTILSHLSFGVHRNLVSEFGFQHPEVLVALDAPEVLLRLQEG